MGAPLWQYFSRTYDSTFETTDEAEELLDKGWVGHVGESAHLVSIGAHAGWADGVAEELAWVASIRAGPGETLRLYRWRRWKNVAMLAT